MSPSVPAHTRCRRRRRGRYTRKKKRAPEIRINARIPASANAAIVPSENAEVPAPATVTGWAVALLVGADVIALLY